MHSACKSKHWLERTRWVCVWAVSSCWWKREATFKLQMTKMWTFRQAWPTKATQWLFFNGMVFRLYLMEFDHDGSSLLLLLIFLHFSLQSLIILQGLLSPLHCHVQTGEHTAVPDIHTNTHSLSLSLLRTKSKAGRNSYRNPTSPSGFLLSGVFQLA